MNLRPMSDISTSLQSLTCYSCGERKPLDTMFADLDGPPFKAWYCGLCAQELRAQMNKETIRA